MKTCTRCSISKELSEFNKSTRRKDGLQPECRQCQSERFSDYYPSQQTKIRQRSIARNKRVRERNRVYISSLNLSCIRCGEDHPAVIDFHHRNQSEKEIEVSIAVYRGWSLKRLKEEIAKCDILCSNCHRKHHWEERNKT